MALATPTTVVLELMTMGQQSAAHLRELLRATSPPVRAEHQALAAEILRCCDRVIAAVSAGATGKKRKLADPDATSTPAAAMPCKRRVRGAEAHREVQSDTTEDGFVWRKYGQKDINGSKHPRLYYRCALSGEGCRATRRVQQSHEVPAAFVIAYYGEHTCGSGFGDACQQGAPPLPPTVVDSGSSACGIFGAFDRKMGSPDFLPSIPAEHGGRRHGEAPSNTSPGWLSPSSSSYSSEVELGTSPVQEFLEGSFDWEWETVVNSLSFDDLLQ